MKYAVKTKKIILMLILYVFITFAIFPASWERLDSDKALLSEFNYYNNAYFEGRLRITAIYWSNELQPTQLAVTHWWQDSTLKVVLNSNSARMADPDTRRQVILHEMCHVASYMWDSTVGSVSDNHKTASFKDQMARLQRLGCNPWPY